MHLHNPRSLLVFLFIVLAGFALAGCNGSSDDNSPPPSSSSSSGGSSGGSSSGGSSSGGSSSGGSSSGGNSSGGSSSGGSSSGGEPDFFGTAAGAPSDYDHLLTYFDQITPENAGKWGSVEATRDVMEWTALDKAYHFAQSNDLVFKFHTLIWGQQQPDWLAGLSDAEQLAEIKEWMTAVAKRYPKSDLIDVVNEPLHAPAGYKAALGGDGETGWDWVIKSFEMAREHFPDATLILNDYSVLQLPQHAADYLEIIKVLQERGLIDGIGVQAHSLERADPAMVKTNLDTLAETGLPIYVSEFDLNFENDARQANVMAELFPVFWEHPDVAGVTYWGYVEGNTWKDYTYLLNADGTERPALTWLVCYLGGGTECPVPTYTSSGWQGDQFGVTLEAELYDDAEGVLAAGSVVAYTNPGDWIAFKNVEFQSGWNKLWVTYSRGLDADTDPTITIYRGSLDSTPVKTIPVPYTGGWNSFETLEIPWTPNSGTEDIYIQFNVDEDAVAKNGDVDSFDEAAVANLDNVRFGRPKPTSEINLVGDGGFEGGTIDGGWGHFGSSSVFNLVTTQVHDGAQSLEVTALPDPDDAGFASYWLVGKVSTGTSYAVSAYVFQDGASADTVRLAAQVTCKSGTAPSGHNKFPWLDNNQDVAPNTWTKLSGTLVIPDGCDPDTVQIYFEGTDSDSTVYLDDVTVTPLNFVADGGVEGVSLAGGWSAFGSGATLSLSPAQPHGGTQSLLADRSGTTGTGGFAAYNLTDFMTAGLSYLASGWVYQTGSGPDTVAMTAKIGCSSGATYTPVANNTAVPANTWTELSGSFQIPLDCDITDVQLYFEGTAEGVNVYVDDVSVTLPADNLVDGGDFEDAAVGETAGWETWYQGGTTLAVTDAKAYAGSQSLLASNRVANSNPSYVLTSLVEAGTTYTVSAQALHTGAAANPLTMTAKLACEGEDDDYIQLATATGVAADTWTALSGTLSIPAGCDVNEARIYFEGTTAGVDVYLDDVSVTAN